MKQSSSALSSIWVAMANASALLDVPVAAAPLNGGTPELRLVKGQSDEGPAEYVVPASSNYYDQQVKVKRSARRGKTGAVVRTSVSMPVVVVTTNRTDPNGQPLRTVAGINTFSFEMKTSNFATLESKNEGRALIIALIEIFGLDDDAAVPSI